MITASIMCLALNIYHEARGEPLAGQLAVGFSTMNRVTDKRYPDTLCGVVKQAKYHDWDLNNPIRYKCQYSWFCDGRNDFPHDDKAMLESIILAQNIYYGQGTDVREGGTHYHAKYVDANWAGDMTVVLEVRQHIFYR